MELNQLAEKEIDLFLFHQASKFVVEELGKKLKIPAEKIPFKAQEYGNTISSSLPLLLQNYLDEDNFSKILISGFGAGLSTATTVLKKIMTEITLDDIIQIAKNAKPDSEVDLDNLDSNKKTTFLLAQ